MVTCNRLGTHRSPFPQILNTKGPKMPIADASKLRARIATLDNFLDDFNGQLDDLLAKSLPETLELDSLPQAKPQVTIPHLVYDLVMSTLLSLTLQFWATEIATSLNSLSQDGGDRPHGTFRVPRTGVLLLPRVALAPLNRTITNVLFSAITSGLTRVVFTTIPPWYKTAPDARRYIVDAAMVRD